MSVLPWRSWCDRPVPNAHRANATDKDIAIDTIPIANDILRRLLPAVCLGELTRNPWGARMRGHAQPQNLTAGMPQDQKSIQQPERDRGDHEQIHRRDAVRVISKKRLPSLGWRTPSSRHVLGNGGLPDIDAELEQTDQGLEQDFNSLDAQYDASQAYIRSQQHAGWTMVRAKYDDAGFSGGNTDP